MSPLHNPSMEAFPLAESKGLIWSFYMGSYIWYLLTILGTRYECTSSLLGGGNCRTNYWNSRFYVHRLLWTRWLVRGCQLPELSETLQKPTIMPSFHPPREWLWCLQSRSERLWTHWADDSITWPNECQWWYLLLTSGLVMELR